MTDTEDYAHDAAYYAAKAIHYSRLSKIFTWVAIVAIAVSSVAIVINIYLLTR